MDAIVTAGGIPLPEDPLYTYTQGHSKALVDVAGKPMIQWVLDALSASQKVDNIIIMGMTEKSGLVTNKPTYYLPNEGRMLANIVAGIQKALELNPGTKYVLIVSSDIPAIKAGMVDWLVDEMGKSPADIYYGVIPREVMEKRFPDSRRTWTHLKDMDVCGADINATDVRMATEHLDTWEELIGKRKSPLKQAATIGYGTLLLMILRRLTLGDLVSRVGERIGIRGQAVVWPWAEAGMDVDKPHQLEIMRADLGKKQSNHLEA
ncbi:MAG TPA: nucleotidyltransferase family protein [Anaerolineales bacterium]|jgi:GTP:adenosylcobinamide-phosphate guanylyltransferase